MTDHVANEAENLMLTDEALETVSGGSWNLVKNRLTNTESMMWKLPSGMNNNYQPRRVGNEIHFFDHAGKRHGRPMPYSAEQGELLGV